MQEFLEEEKLLRWRDVEDVFKKGLEEIFKKFCFFSKISTQMSTFILFESVEVLHEGAFSLWLSLTTLTR